MSAESPIAGSPSVAVSQFVSMARQALERALPTMWIGGEISGFLRAASGHCYFTLKDERAQVRCVLWRGKAQLLDLKLADGMAVDVRATPTPAPAATDTAVYRTFDGQVIELAGRREGEKAFVTVAARRDADLAAKFHGLVDPVLGKSQADDLVAQSMRIASANDVRALVAAARPR